MKKRTNLPWPMRGVQARQIHVRGPIRMMRDLVTVQQNECGRDWLNDFRAEGGFNLPRPDILYWMRDLAQHCKVFVPKHTLL